ncbi:SymE family type I addiction module toxin [Thalassomonas actiniarum]|uniref:Type I addiction module toxin, SymE family n=1 Tax=Thalassomonas actiniarum TaxID=485447 RepID=A0AAE9YNH6_9GAMM|nr:SymE family type I addiction module toxin [Thalassomonas actiniarum]WDD97573.1 type I addiction module toxin, SymE family [Thalassomonas actiniarum]
MAEYHHTSELCPKEAKYPTIRQLTVLETVLNSVVKVRGAGINYLPVNLQPCLILQGKWLHEAGFPIGQKVTVTVEKDRLVLKPVSLSPKA